MQKLSENKKRLIEFLIKESGKPENISWVELATTFGIKDPKGNVSGENARQLWKNYRKNMDLEQKVNYTGEREETSAHDFKNIVEELQKDNFKVKSLWTSGKNVNISIAPDTEKVKEDTSEILKNILMVYCFQLID